MAMFHFRLKSDKKPDGTKISAAEVKDACNGIETLLYKTDDFGSIKNSAQGIEVTENAYPITLTIALMLADEVINHKTLIISGAANFKKAIVNAAISVVSIILCK